MSELKSVIIEIIEGRKLPGRIVVEVAQFQEMTADIPDENPQWGQEFHFPILEDAVVRFVYLNGVEELGMASLPLQELRLGENVIETWLPVTRDEEQVGELFVRMEGLGEEGRSPQAEAFLLSVLRAEGLTKDGSYSVDIQIGGTNIRTAVRAASFAGPDESDPVWNETFPMRLTPADVLQVVLHDHVTGADVGFASITGQDLLLTSDFGRDVQLPLETPEGEKLAVLVLRTELDESAASGAAALPVPSQQLVIHAVCAEQLPVLENVRAVLVVGDHMYNTATHACPGSITFNEFFTVLVDPRGIIEVSVESAGLIVGRADVPVEALLQVAENHKQLEVEIGNEEAKANGLLILSASFGPLPQEAGVVPIPIHAPAPPLPTTIPPPEPTTSLAPPPAAPQDAAAAAMPALPLDRNSLAVEVVSTSLQDPVPGGVVAIELSVAGRAWMTGKHDPTEALWNETHIFRNVDPNDMLQGMVLAGWDFVSECAVPAARLYEVANTDQCLSVELMRTGKPAGTVVLASTFPPVLEPEPTPASAPASQATEPYTTYTTETYMTGGAAAVPAAQAGTYMSGATYDNYGTAQRQVLPSAAPTTSSATCPPVEATITRHTLDGRVLTSTAPNAAAYASHGAQPPSAAQPQPQPQPQLTTPRTAPFPTAPYPGQLPSTGPATFPAQFPQPFTSQPASGMSQFQSQSQPQPQPQPQFHSQSQFQSQFHSQSQFQSESQFRGAPAPSPGFSALPPSNIPGMYSSFGRQLPPQQSGAGITYTSTAAAISSFMSSHNANNMSCAGDDGIRVLSIKPLGGGSASGSCGPCQGFNAVPSGGGCAPTAQPFSPRTQTTGGMAAQGGSMTRASGSVPRRLPTYLPSGSPSSVSHNVSASQPFTFTSQPSTSAYQHATSASAYQPSASASQPSTSAYQPSASTYQPSTSTYQPSASGACQPCAPGASDADTQKYGGRVLGVSEREYFE